MTSRDTPGLHLPRSPLIFVLAQVRIAPVLSVEKKIPEIQERLRKNGFPKLNERKISIEQRLPDGSQQIQSVRQWEFINKANTCSALITHDALTYQTTRYDVFEQFIESFEEVLRVFGECMEPTLSQRLGLRYVDLVVPQEGKSLESYFSDRLRGFNVQDSDLREGFVSESICQTGPSTKFIHRYAEAVRGFGFPPDLLPLSLKIERPLQLKAPFGLLDLDHFSSAEEDFSYDSILRQFWSLHDHQTKAFRASVTNEALAEWEQP